MEGCAASNGRPMSQHLDNVQLPKVKTDESGSTEDEPKSICFEPRKVQSRDFVMFA